MIFAFFFSLCFYIVSKNFIMNLALVFYCLYDKLPQT